MGQRIDNPNTHGTGCTLSSNASNLAKGYDLDESIERAKNYLSDALAAMLDLGKGSGPMQHNFNLNGTYKGSKGIIMNATERLLADSKDIWDLVPHASVYSRTVKTATSIQTNSVSTFCRTICISRVCQGFRSGRG